MCAIGKIHIWIRKWLEGGQGLASDDVIKDGDNGKDDNTKIDEFALMS